MANSPAEVVRQLIVDRGFVSGGWQSFVDNEPDSPDNVITVYNTDGLILDRMQRDGSHVIHHGVQIRVRSTVYRDGWDKLASIALKLQTDEYHETVVVGSNEYFLESFDQSSDVLALGTESPVSHRWIFTFNGVVLLEFLGTVV